MNTELSKLAVVVLDTCRDETSANPTTLPRRDGPSISGPVLGSHVASILVGLGANNVFVCDNVEGARRQIAENTVSAVLLHTCDGEEVAVTRALRAGDDTPPSYVPIILVATGADAVRRAYEAGVHDFIAKPIAPAALSSTLLASIGGVLSDVA